MREVWNWIVTHYSYFVLLGVVVIIYLTAKYKQVRLMVYALMLYVEEVLATEEGRQKKQAVIVSIRNFIPKGLRWLFPENTIERFIDDGMKWLNDYLDDGKINNSHNKLTEQVLKVKDEKIDKANQELRKNLINIRF